MQLHVGYVTSRFMIEVIRDKLPKGRAYPIKATVVERAIAEVGVRTSVRLFLHHGTFWDSRPLFSASFYLAGSLVKNDDEQFWLGCRSVDVAHCVSARTFLEAEAIPAFAKWAAELERLPYTSTRRRTQETIWDWHRSNVR